MIKKPLAIVTMVYNEPQHLTVWKRHYGSQVGEQACYVLDHGSTDGSTENLGHINRVRIPRSPQDDERRARAIGQFCASLLEWYDSVIYVDVDELLVADPERFPSLISFAQSSFLPAVTATGFDVIHRLGTEMALDYSQLISLQRRHIRFSSAMCKTVLIRQPVTWAPGFHCCTEILPDPCPNLFLFHLRYADLDSGLQRLTRTRVQPWCSDTVGQHQRLADTDWSDMLSSMSGLSVTEGELNESDTRFCAYRRSVQNSVSERVNERYRLDIHINGNELCHLPERFIGRL